jgi:hypothetical protein
LHVVDMRENANGLNGTDRTDWTVGPSLHLQRPRRIAQLATGQLCPNSICGAHGRFGCLNCGRCRSKRPVPSFRQDVYYTVSVRNF